MSDSASDRSSSIQVIDRLRALLDALAAEGGNATLKILAAVTGLAPSTAFRILASAQDNTLITRDAVGHYRFGPHLQDWAQLAPGRSDLRAIARPIMAWLRDQVQETVNLTIQQDDEVVYVERATPSRMMRVEQVIGSRAPLHTTAVGKLMLALNGEAAVERYATRTHLPALTIHTLHGIPTLWKDAHTALERGYALDNEEAEIGVGCLGVLLRGPLPWNAGLSISAPIERRQESWVPLLQEAARRIDMRLQGQTVTLDMGALS
ncbi:IclR family transcriptional regulator [Acidithiobacillus sp. MC6.1]|nr:IclR family transcriptional regulator [Acidithiobacillus sp. MC6.1]